MIALYIGASFIAVLLSLVVYEMRGTQAALTVLFISIASIYWNLRSKNKR